MENQWTYVSAFSYESQHFSIWVKPVLQDNGVYGVETKSKETTLEEINNDAKAHGMSYFSKLPEE